MKEKDLSKSRGGIVAASKLTPEERHERAKRGAAARWQKGEVFESNDVKRAIFGSPEQMLKIGDTYVECYVLEGGTRVLSGRGMQQAIGLGGDSKTHGGKLRDFLTLETIKPHVNSELAMALNAPQKFIRPGRGGLPATAFEATLLIDLCEAIVNAKDEKGFRSSWLPLVYQAQIITLSFAKAGIISAIDEVTGYQEVREKDEIQKIVDKYLTDYARKWTRVFPHEFWPKLLKIKGYESYIGLKRPSFVGHWINDIIYSRLAPQILTKLKELNPREKNGYRKHKHHSFLTEDHGVPELKDHIVKVMGLMDASLTCREFEKLLDRAAPKVGSTMNLGFED